MAKKDQAKDEKVLVSFRMPEALRQEMDVRAIYNKQGTAEIIVAAIEHYLKTTKAGPKLKPE